MSDSSSPLSLILAVDKEQSKQFYRDGVGKVVDTSIRPNMYWSSQTHTVSSLQDLYAKLLRIQTQKKKLPYLAVMRGQWLPDDELFALEAERKKRNEEAETVDPRLRDRIIYKVEESNYPRKIRKKTVVRDVPLNWVCFDFDGFEVDGVPFDIENPFPSVDAAIKSELGKEFSIANYVLQLSSSAGIKPGIRAHCWFWLKNPFSEAHWQQWYKNRSAELGRKPLIDKGLFESTRIHFIAPPTFKDDDIDPLKGKKRWHRSTDGCDDVVNLDVPDVAERKVDSGFFDLESDDEEAKDAFSRPGIVGIFNRCYSMSDTIQTFLSEHYRIDTPEGRVSWLPSDSREGCRIFAGNTKMYSSHNHDPLGGKPGNAFDHIQAVLFDDDYGAAAEWASSLPRCIEERVRSAAADFDDDTMASDFVSKIEIGRLVEKQEVLTPEKVMLEYPMPEKWHGQKAVYRLGPNGWRYGFMEEDEDKDRAVFRELWSPISIWSYDRCTHTGAVTLVLKMMDKEQKPIEVVAHRGEAVSKAILSLLWERGWNATGANGEKFVDFMRSNGDAAVHNRYVAPQRGWLESTDVSGRKINLFAAPSGAVIGSEASKVGEIGLRADWIVEGARRGTYEKWRGAVEEMCSIENVPHWVLGVAAGFAGPLMRLFGGGTVGIVISGATSHGKSTALGWAASAWTSPEERRGGLMKSMKTTTNAIEHMAAGANGTVLLLDETNLMDGRQLESAVYSIASGSGKQRLKVDGTARETTHWSTFVLMTGEAGLAQRFEASSGKKMGQGAAVRLLDMDVSEVNGKVPLDVIFRLRDTVYDNHGWAGEMFVKQLVDAGYADDAKTILEMRKRFVNEIAGGDPVGVSARAADILAILKVGVELALQWGVLPEAFRGRFDDAIRALWAQVMGGAVFNSNATIINQIQFWVNSRWDRSVVEVGNSSGVRDVEAWYDAEIIYVTPEKLLEATGNVVREIEIKKVLDENESIISVSEKAQKKFNHRYIPGVANLKHVRLVRNKFRDSGGTVGDKPEDLF